MVHTTPLELVWVVAWLDTLTAFPPIELWLTLKTQCCGRAHSFASIIDHVLSQQHRRRQQEDPPNVGDSFRFCVQQFRYGTQGAAGNSTRVAKGLDVEEGRGDKDRYIKRLINHSEDRTTIAEEMAATRSRTNPSAEHKANLAKLEVNGAGLFMESLIEAMSATAMDHKDLTEEEQVAIMAAAFDSSFAEDSSQVRRGSSSRAV